MSGPGMVGDKVGYVVVKRVDSQWRSIGGPRTDTVSEAVGILRTCQVGRPDATFAVARLELVMISRPDENA